MYHKRQGVGIASKGVRKIKRASFPLPFNGRGAAVKLS